MPWTAGFVRHVCRYLTFAKYVSTSSLVAPDSAIYVSEIQPLSWGKTLHVQGHAHTLRSAYLWVGCQRGLYFQHQHGVRWLVGVRACAYPYPFRKPVCARARGVGVACPVSCRQCYIFSMRCRRRLPPSGHSGECYLQVGTAMLFTRARRYRALLAAACWLVQVRTISGCIHTRTCTQ